MKYLTPILLSLIIVGCSSIKELSLEKVEGKYIWKGVYGVTETIEIKSDSTFIFSWAQGLMNGKTLGKIESINDQLSLNSQFKPDMVDFEVEIPPQSKQDYYEIMVGDKDQDRFIGANCVAFLDGNFVEGASTNEMGICKIKSLEIDTVVISYLGYKDAVLTVKKNNTPKSLIVRLNVEEHYQYFEGQAIRLTNKNTIKLKTFGRKKIFRRINN